MQWHIRRGPYLIGSGSGASMDGVFVPAGCTLHEGAPPPEASNRPDTTNNWRFNMERERWEMEPPSAELLWARVRYKRDELLAACDWVVTRAAERGQPVPAAWQAYRQALRDITAQPDPACIAWPQAPA